MKTLTYQLRDLKKLMICIGFEDENNRTQVRIDCGEVFGEYPNAAVSMKVQAPKGGIYPATVTREGNMILWTVRDCDVANKGSGEFQLTFTDGTTVIKTCVGRFHVDRSLKGSGTAPSGVQDWLENAEKVLEQVESAEIHQPMIGLDGYWYTWDQENEEYVKTNTKAQGSGADLIDDTTPAENKVFSSSKVDTELRGVKSAIDGIDQIIGRGSQEVVTMPEGYKSASYSNSSQTRVFKYENDKLRIKVARSTTGSLNLIEATTTDAALTIGDSLAYTLESGHEANLKLHYINNVANVVYLTIRYYKENFSQNIAYYYYPPTGEGDAVLDLIAIAEQNEINIATYPKVVIRSLSSPAHTATVIESTELQIKGFQTSIQSVTIDERVDDLENSVDGMTEATAEDVGKALKAKTVANGKVTEWEFGTVQEKEPADLYALRKDVPSYYLAYPASPASFDEQEYLEGRIKAVPEGKSFIFVTDTHWESNNKHTFDLIRYVKEKLGINKVIFGGDLIDREDDKYKGLNIVRDFMNIAVQALGTDFIPAVGNHDNNMGNVITSGLVSATYRIPYDLLFNTMIKHLEGVAVFEDKSTAISSVALTDADASELTGWSKLHYYVDDEKNQTRYIVIYSSCPDDVFLPNYTGFAWDGGGGPSTVMQIDWFADVLSHTPAGYDVIVVAHCADAENTTFPARQQLRSYFEHFVHIASAVHQKSSGYKINISSFDETSCPSNAFWTRETKEWDFSNAPTLGKILFMAGHIHRNAEYVTRIDTPSATNPTFVKGKARNNGNPALVGSVEGVEVFDSATVDFDGGEILTIITQNDAYIQATGTKYTAELATMTQNTITDQCFDVITLTDSGVVCTRIGAGWDRVVPVKWLPSN